MSITVTINGNYDYCDAHQLTVKQEEECLCVHHEATEASCPFCKGSGVYVDVLYPFEMNLANRNFATLWNSLGLEFDYTGSIDARLVRDALSRLPQDLLLRSTRREGNCIDFGISEAQASSYVSRLQDICDEAERREELITWS